VTDAKAALREFARTNRLRVTRCNTHNPNLGEPSLLQVRFSQSGRRVCLRAATSLLELEFRCADRAFGFGINRPDKICLLNIAVPSLQRLTPWPLFVGDLSDAPALRDWLTAGDHRSLIERFACSERESVQVFLNGVVAVVEPTRAFADVARAVISLADSLPRAAASPEIDCQDQLPADLLHLERLFSRWAISDDEERHGQVGRSRKAARAQLRRVVEPLLSRIDEYLDSLEEPLSPCALRLGYLAELVAELRRADA
jgi:hypothetical protein